MRLYMLLEVIQNRLPTLALHVDRVLGFGVEGFGNVRVSGMFIKAGAHGTAIIHRVINLFMVHDSRVLSPEIEPKAAIFCFHAVGERATFA